MLTKEAVGPKQAPNAHDLLQGHMPEEKCSRNHRVCCIDKANYLLVEQGRLPVPPFLLLPRSFPIRIGGRLLIHGQGQD